MDRIYTAPRLIPGIGIIVGVVMSLWLTGPAQAQVSRAEAIEIAERYLRFEWKPSARNAFHGVDKDGVRVDTPDASYTPKETRPGWWVAGQVNQGMPYKWGGFCSPEEFRAGLKRGRYAGDIYTAEKRRLGDAAVSRHVIGIDCSGLISRCWKLERPYSTRKLPTLCEPLASYDDLKPGDILNSPNNHVLLFKAFAPEGKTRLLAYEAGSPPSWKVLLNSIPVVMLREQGYLPMRYRKVRD
jgi:hypothetical protein